MLPPAPTTPAQPGLLSPLRLSDGWRELDKALRHIGEINSAAIRLDAAEGRWDRVAERVDFARAVARHALSLPTVSFAQTGLSIERGAISAAAREVRERRPGANEIDAILLAAGEAIDAASLIDAAMHGETLVVLDTVHLLHTQGLSQPGMLLAPPFEETRRRIESHLAATREWARESPALGVARREPKPSSGRRFGRSAIFIEFLEDMHLPTFVQSARQRATWRETEMLTLRLERFRAEHRRLPTTLDEAMTPEQTLDPVSGVPFVYELSDDGGSYRLTLSPSAGAWMKGVDFTETEANEERSVARCGQRRGHDASRRSTPSAASRSYEVDADGATHGRAPARATHVPEHERSTTRRRCQPVTDRPCRR